MKNIKWRNLLELVGMIITIVLSIVFFKLALASETMALNYLMCSYIVGFIGLCLGYDIYEKIRG